MHEDDCLERMRLDQIPGGLIGNYLVQLAPQFTPAWCVHGWVRRELDLLDFAAVTGTFRRERPALVIHCAAFSQSQACTA